MCLVTSCSDRHVVLNHTFSLEMTISDPISLEIHRSMKKKKKKKKKKKRFFFQKNYFTSKKWPACGFA